MDTLQDRAVIQKDLYRFEEQARRILMKLNKDKCKSLHLGRKWSLQCYRLETGAWGVALLERPLKRAA